MAMTEDPWQERKFRDGRRIGIPFWGMLDGRVDPSTED